MDRLKNRYQKIKPADPDILSGSHCVIPTVTEFQQSCQRYGCFIVVMTNSLEHLASNRDEDKGLVSALFFKNTFALVHLSPN